MTTPLAFVIVALTLTTGLKASRTVNASFAVLR